MPIQAPQWTEFLSCPICQNQFDNLTRSPISLGCSHTICKHCLSNLHRKQCPFDQCTINIELENSPINYALLQLVGVQIPSNDDTINKLNLTPQDKKLYLKCKTCIEDLAILLKPSSGRPLVQGSNPPCTLSRPMQRKLIALINCQTLEEEGRGRAMRAARSIGERAVTELNLQHQNPQQLSANLWAAVRARGCQFLGPAMQEEVLKLVLLALEDGSALSRKVLVMFVVQRLEPHFPQASKTSIGHVVQLLYRASCFKVSKREGDSSLMQLKEEFRTYESLRREHDAQIVEIATEAGLRIAPDQWSSLLYGDASRKSHMQSIIDKLQNPQSFAQSVQELVIALQRTGDPGNLSNLRQQYELLSEIDPTSELTGFSWSDLYSALESTHQIVNGLIQFVSNHGNNRRCMNNNNNNNNDNTNNSILIHNGKYKVSLCRDLTLRGMCPRNIHCTFAHSEEELEKYRNNNNKSRRHSNRSSICKSDEGQIINEVNLITNQMLLSTSPGGGGGGCGGGGGRGSNINGGSSPNKYHNHIQEHHQQQQHGGIGLNNGHYTPHHQQQQQHITSPTNIYNKQQYEYNNNNLLQNNLMYNNNNSSSKIYSIPPPIQPSQQQQPHHLPPSIETHQHQQQIMSPQQLSPQQQNQQQKYIPPIYFKQQQQNNNVIINDKNNIIIPQQQQQQPLQYQQQKNDNSSSNNILRTQPQPINYYKNNNNNNNNSSTTITTIIPHQNYEDEFVPFDTTINKFGPISRFDIIKQQHQQIQQPPLFQSPSSSSSLDSSSSPNNNNTNTNGYMNNNSSQYYMSSPPPSQQHNQFYNNSSQSSLLSTTQNIKLFNNNDDNSSLLSNYVNDLKYFNNNNNKIDYDQINLIHHKNNDDIIPHHTDNDDDLLLSPQKFCNNIYDDNDKDFIIGNNHIGNIIIGNNVVGGGCGIINNMNGNGQTSRSWTDGWTSEEYKSDDEESLVNDNIRELKIKFEIELEE